MIIVNERVAAALRDLGWVVGRDMVVSQPLPAIHRLTETDYAATLPKRMADTAELLNSRCAHLLPGGVRFEWTASDGVAQDRG